MIKTVTKMGLGIFALVILTACGGASPKTNAENDDKKFNAIVAPIYIHIDKKGDDFIPVNLSSIREAGHTSVLVIGRDGVPFLEGFRTGGAMDCGKGRGHTKNVYCQNDTPFFSNSIGVRFKPYGVIVLHKENLYDFLSSNDLNEKVEKYNALNSFITEKLKQFDPYVEQQTQSYIKKEPQYTIVINDKSGLYDKSIDFNSAVKYNYNTLDKANYVLPAYQLKDSSSFFSTEKNKFEVSLGSIEKELHKKVQEQNKYVSMYYAEPYSEKYVYKIHEVKKAYFGKKAKINIDIETANIKLNYPILKINDKVLSVDNGKENTAKFQNDSNDFVSIKSISYYLNRDILTDTDFDKNSILEIAPEAYIEFTKEGAEEKFYEALNYENITAKALKNKKINYGIAVKYVNSSSGKVKTLYKKINSNALNIYRKQ